MKRRASILNWIPFFLLLSCQSAPPPSPGDWADVTLRATGTGPIRGEWSASERMQAVQRAKVDAYGKLESQVLALQINSKKTVQELAQKDEGIRKKITAFVKGAKIVDTENADQGIEVTAELFLGESFKATLGLLEKKSNPLPKDKREDGFSR